MSLSLHMGLLVFGTGLKIISLLQGKNKTVLIVIFHRQLCLTGLVPSIFLCSVTLETVGEFVK